MTLLRNKITPSKLRFFKLPHIHYSDSSSAIDTLLFDTELKSDKIKQDLKLLLLQSVYYRVANIPSIAFHTKDADLEEEAKYNKSPHAEVAVMFSGGLDSTLLSALLAEVLDPIFAIDLVNVSF